MSLPSVQGLSSRRVRGVRGASPSASPSPLPVAVCSPVGAVPFGIHDSPPRGVEYLVDVDGADGVGAAGAAGAAAGVVVSYIFILVIFL